MSDKTSNECSICFSEIQNDFKIVLDCSHYFCRDCMKQIRNPICPCCRAPITSKSVSQEDIDAMNAKKSEDKKERESHFPEGIPDDIREFISRMGGNIRVEVVAIPVEDVFRTFRLCEELYRTCYLVLREIKNNLPPLESAITITINAVMVRSLCLDKDTKGCLRLTCDTLRKELPKIYKDLRPSFIREKIEIAASQYSDTI